MRDPLSTTVSYDCSHVHYLCKALAPWDMGVRIGAHPYMYCKDARTDRDYES